MTEVQIATSVLVVGTGAAGMRTAIELAERGLDVLAVGKPARADTLVDRIAPLHVAILDSVCITRLLVRDGVVFGAYGFDLHEGTRYLFYADAVVLAAGGHTGIWRHSSSPRDEDTGVSIRLAVDAGARVRDAELVQFHPFGLVEPAHAAGTLVSEAARDEGGVLRNRLGDRFMARYDPERMERSTRDWVAAAAYTEIKEGRGTRHGGVWLDISHLSRETILDRLPCVYEALLELQMLDVTSSPIEVAPTAHSSVGGVWVRPEDGGTDVEGLYAVGEAASGMHSGDRLRGSSLVELPVDARIVGAAAARYSARRSTRPRSASVISAARDEIGDLVAADGPESVRTLQRAIRDLMTEHAGVVRDEAGLRAGLAELDVIDARIAAVGVHPAIASFRDLAHAFDLKASAVAARATLEAALERCETTRP